MKRKDGLETRAVLLISSLELEISVVVVRGIYQNSRKWMLPVKIFLVKMTLMLLQSHTAVMIMVPTFLR